MILLPIFITTRQDQQSLKTKFSKLQAVLITSQDHVIQTPSCTTASQAASNKWLAITGLEIDTRQPLG